ncbi:MAG: glutamate ligase domain-containing protein, partial [Actinomycetota bacterium]
STGARSVPNASARVAAGARAPAGVWGAARNTSRWPATTTNRPRTPTRAEAFGTDRAPVLVVGMLRGREAGAMLEALGAARARLVVACPAPSPRTLPPAEVAAAARSLGVEAWETASVPEAVAAAVDAAGADDLVVVTGSLYVVGAARAALRRPDGGELEDGPGPR